MVELARKTGRVIASAVPLVLGALLIWLLVPWWIRGGVFYIAVVLVSLRAPLSRITVAAAATATAVIAIGDFFPAKTETPEWMIIIHCTLWITAIWATIAVVLLRNRSEEERVRFFEMSVDLLCVAGFDGHLKRVNPAFTRTLGWTTQELLARPFIEFVHPVDRGRVTAEMERLIRGLPSTQFEVRQPCKDGSYRWISWSAVPLPGKRLSYAVGRDVTGQKQASEALRDSEERYRLLLDGVQDHAIFMVDTAGNVASWSAAAERSMGYRTEEIVGQHFSHFYTPDGIASGKPAEALRIAEAEGRFEEEGWRAGRDGSRYWVHVVIVPLRNPDGRLRGFCINRRDLSEQKRTEEALQESRRFAERTVRTTPDQIYVYDLLKRRVVFWNPSFAEFVGTDPETLEGANSVFLEESLHSDDMPGLPNLLQRVAVAKDDEIIETDFRRRASSGQLHWLRSRYVVLSRTDTGSAQDILCLAVDVTERREMLETLRSSEADLRRSQKALQALTARLISAEEDQRKRLARELHDDLNQRVTIMAIDTAKLDRDLPLPPDLIRERMQDLQEQLGRLSDDIRTISHQLHPATLDHLGLRAAVEAECQAFSRLEGIRIDCLSDDLPEIADDVALCVYRILQETLKNIAKHAHATKVGVRLEGTESELILTVEDSGVGFDPPSVAAKAGLGLVTMEERIRLAGGTLAVSSEVGRGTRVEARMPLTGPVQ